jgi:O-antigen/teichoic acid export membrane protein
VENSNKIESVLRIVKNSASLFLSAALVKGGGLIVTILVARYLDASALGFFSVILSLSLIIEVLTPLGQQDYLIRTIARDQSFLISQWINAFFTTILVGIVFLVSIVSFVQMKNFGADVNLALYFTAFALPIAGANLVTQGVLQGAERMEFQPLAALLGRTSGLIILWILLVQGAGFWAAFAARGVFQIISLIILSVAIYHLAIQKKQSRKWNISFDLCKKNIVSSIPFSVQRFLTEGLNRIIIIILPMLISMEAVGLFNAAYQITITIYSIIPMIMITVLPLFSRTFRKDRAKSSVLVNQMLKFVFILIFPLVMVITIAAEDIILLLYGKGYEASVQVLQLVIWSLVFFAADSMLKQIMIASNKEKAMVFLSVIGMILNIVLMIVFGKLYGIIGIAASILIAKASMLLMDAYFVSKFISSTKLINTAARPLLCALAAGVTGLILMDYEMTLIIAISTVVYIGALFVLRVFTNEELIILRQLLQRLRTGVIG